MNLRNGAIRYVFSVRIRDRADNQLEDVPHAPLLDVVMVDCSTRQPQSADVTDSFSQLLQNFPSQSSQLLEGQPRTLMQNTTSLRTLHSLRDVKKRQNLGIFSTFDEIKQSNDQVGIISSYRTEGHTAEITHMRIMFDKVIIWDSVFGGSINRRIVHSRGNREDLMEFQARDENPGWQDLTTYVVIRLPMEILEEMRQVEGIGFAEWVGKRGIEVSGKCWEVLERWNSEMRERDEKH